MSDCRSTGTELTTTPPSLRTYRTPLNRRAQAKRHYEKYKAERREEWNARSRAFAVANREVVRRRARNAHFKRKYGMTHEDWDAAFAAQGSRCGSCGADTPGSKKGHWWHTDHDHTTGKFRGILCGRCNIALGYFENAELNRNLAAYLEKANVAA